MINRDYYCHQSFGVMSFDSECWWARVECDPGIVRFYSWLSQRYGQPVVNNWKFGISHISFLKSERPVNLDLWGIDPGPIEFWYSNIIRTDNDRHAWLDVWSDQLIDYRTRLGLPPKLKMSYHLTLGRLT